MGDDPNAQGQDQDGQDQGAEDQPNAIDFAAWIADQSTDVQQAFEGYESGLRNTVAATREDNKSLKEALKSASAQADGELKTQLDALSGKLEEREREVAFIDQAVEQGVEKPRALWVLAKAAEAFDRYGKPDWQHLRSEYPMMFRTAPAPRGNAGAGAGTQPPGRVDMEAQLRKAAGRG